MVGLQAGPSICSCWTLLWWQVSGWIVEFLLDKLQKSTECKRERGWEGWIEWKKIMIKEIKKGGVFLRLKPFVLHCK